MIKYSIKKGQTMYTAFGDKAEEGGSKRVYFLKEVVVVVVVEVEVAFDMDLLRAPSNTF
jgi:hypothetical protein